MLGGDIMKLEKNINDVLGGYKARGRHLSAKVKVIDKIPCNSIVVLSYGGRVKTYKVPIPFYNSITVGEVIDIWGHDRKRNGALMLPCYEMLVLYDLVMGKRGGGVSQIMNVFNSVTVDVITSYSAVKVNCYFSNLPKCRKSFSHCLKDAYEQLKRELIIT